MSSIPHNPDTVKHTQKSPSKKWAEKKLEAETLAKRMWRYPTLRARAARMMQCGDIVLMQYCPRCHKEHAYSGNLCRDRLCPVCGWRLSLSRYSQMLATLDLLSDSMNENDVRCSMLTLTLRNCTIDKLHDTLVAMSNAWRNMAKQKYFRDSVYAWTRSIEITYNARQHTYHPHMHILLFGYGRSLADNTMFTAMAIEAWKKALGLDYDPIYNHKTAYTKEDSKKMLASVEELETLSWREQANIAARQAAVEVSKYIMGDKMGLKIPQAHLLEFAEAIKGVRMVGYGGAIKIARQALGLVDDAIDSTSVHNECSACGAALRNYIMRWAGCGYILEPYDRERRCGEDG